MAEFRKVSLADVPSTPNPTSEKHELDEAVGAEEFGFNVYVAEPGEQVPWGRHRHPDHEELFYVLSGELRVETPDGEYRLGPDEALFVPKDGTNKAYGAGDGPTKFVAVGAPKDRDGSVIEEECPACGEVTDREYEERDVDGEPVYVLFCAGCGAETDRFGA